MYKTTLGGQKYLCINITRGYEKLQPDNFTYCRSDGCVGLYCHHLLGCKQSQRII